MRKITAALNIWKTMRIEWSRKNGFSIKFRETIYNFANNERMAIRWLTRVWGLSNKIARYRLDSARDLEEYVSIEINSEIYRDIYSAVLAATEIEMENRSREEKV